ncbi:hypothetical protein [Paenibacillus sp.]|uniref:hypothetical protein n=1 Tax=Paenibacillus sp. TaxID=58172 RepID=UPI002D4E78CC|nr:hypothetical protein [Paenibacillus sp.]HZG88036.1 hypothetical protein [Paenibacillus sp.]
MNKDVPDRYDFDYRDVSVNRVASGIKVFSWLLAGSGVVSLLIPQFREAFGPLLFPLALTAAAAGVCLRGVAEIVALLETISRKL